MSFSFSTIKDFESHIRASIRGYDDLVNDVVSISSFFIEDNTNVYDIGCSTGHVLYKIHNNPTSTYIGIDKETTNFRQYHEKYNRQNISFVYDDITNYKLSNASLVLSLFTIQFINQAHKQTVIDNIYNCLNPGGALLIAEKIYSSNTKINDIVSQLYCDFKEHNFSLQDIKDKERSLRRMFKLNTKDELVDMCNSAGFVHIDPIWQNHNFICYIAIK
jgi:tRNA (cmo5U34)-methyltransferase